MSVVPPPPLEDAQATPPRKNAASSGLKKRCFQALGACFLLLVLTLTALLFFPELWFRSSVVGVVSRKLAVRGGYDLRFSELVAKAHRFQWRALEFELQAKNMALTAADRSLEILAPEVNVKVSVLWLALPPRVLRADTIKLNVEKIALGESAETQSEGDDGAQITLPDLSAEAWVPRFIQDLKLITVGIHLARLEIPSFGVLRADLNRDGHGPLKLDVRDTPHDTRRDFRGRRKGRVQAEIPVEPTGEVRWGGLSADLDLDLPGAGRLQAKIKSAPCEEGKDCLTGDASWKPRSARALRAHSKFRLIAEPHAIVLAFEAQLKSIAPGVSAIETKRNCRLEARSLEDWALDAMVRCGVAVGLSIPPLDEVKDIREFKFPQRLEADLVARVRLKEVSGQSAYDGTLLLDSDPFATDLLKAVFQVKSEFHGKLSEKNLGFHQNTLLTANVDIPEIARPIRLLHPTAWAVPAPFNNLKGPIRVGLRSTWTDWETRSPFELTTQLDSREQSFETRARGVFEYGAGGKNIAHLKADWTLQDVRISAPRFQPQNIPRLIPDPAIRLSSASAVRAPDPDAFFFHYDVKVESARERPVKLDTSLLADPLLLHVQAQLSDQKPLTLKVELEPTSFVVFRKKGSLDSFAYWVDSDTRVAQVDGKARLRSGEYSILAHFYGRTDRVHLDLTSEPPVPDEDLWAILLFGEPLTALDDDQQESSQAAARALQQGAVGLASLYVFASTPIERVSFDPFTQRVTVSFRVQEGTSLDLGRSEESSAEVGLRKRLGGGFRLNFQVLRPSESTSSSSSSEAQVGAGLEWRSRY